MQEKERKLNERRLTPRGGRIAKGATPRIEMVINEISASLPHFRENRLFSAELT
jgi:hypothetical protein